ncbi:hypothetical protein G6F56_000214 [Rhizopus delemar]|uniref:Uncharacterized protein n=1 Tax=Rhizopus stolonifer TaxID=4846 RepID=A0A367JNL8_RHIST|nr:hypothetical protein G6F56_000214 [Rhizopus delemar]RCH91301.1 hypothetical protein CU098_003765 [Rhizopus stolonifer]
MWRKRDSVLVDLYKNHSREDLPCPNKPRSLYKYTKREPSLIYAGSDFDVFGKEQTPSPFAALYNIEPYISKSPEEKEEIILARGFKRGQWDALLDSTAIIKKRKVKQVHGPEDVFFKTTAPYNTPSNIFMTQHHQHLEDPIDLEYC